MRGPSGHPRSQGWPPWRPAYGKDVVRIALSDRLRIRLLAFGKTAEIWARRLSRRSRGGNARRNGVFIPPLILRRNLCFRLDCYGFTASEGHLWCQGWAEERNPKSMTNID
jgi:hypothetical protein